MVEAIIDSYDIFENAVSGINITYAQALAGYQQSHQIDLYNSSTYYLNNVVAWIDRYVDFIDISDDDASWVSYFGVPKIIPANVLELGDIASGASTPLYIRRSIPAGTIAHPKELVLVHLHFSGPPI